MENRIQKKKRLQEKRSWRVRKKLRGTRKVPRICVVKSNRHLHAQIIDDESGRTLASVATFDSEFRSSDHSKKNKESGRQLGKRIAEKAQKMQIESVIFDRGKSKYHGILAEFANAARGQGLKF